MSSILYQKIINMPSKDSVFYFIDLFLKAENNAINKGNVEFNNTPTKRRKSVAIGADKLHEALIPYIDEDNRKIINDEPISPDIYQKIYNWDEEIFAPLCKEHDTFVSLVSEKIMANPHLEIDEITSECVNMYKFYFAQIQNVILGLYHAYAPPQRLESSENILGSYINTKKDNARLSSINRELKTLCKNFKDALENRIPLKKVKNQNDHQEALNPSHPYQSEITLVGNLIACLENPAITPEDQYKKFKSLFIENQSLLMKHKDNVFLTFFKSVWAILTKGIQSAQSIWSCRRSVKSIEKNLNEGSSIEMVERSNLRIR